MKGSEFCWVHNPEVSQQRYAAQKKGGATNQAKHNPKANVGHIPTEIRSIEDLLALLDYTLAEFLMLNNSLNRNKALVQLAGAYSQVLKDSDMEDRLDELNDEIQGLLKKASKMRKVKDGR